MRWISATVVAGLLAVLPALAPAQGGEEDPRIRRQRELAEHDARIKAIIKQRQEEAKARNDRERMANPGGDSRLVDPPQPTPTNEVGTNIEEAPRVATPVGEGNPAVTRTGEQGRAGHAKGATLLYYNFPTDRHPRQLDTIVKDGDQFISEVVLLNQEGATIDSLSLALSYDKRFFKPVKVFDSQIRRYSSQEPEFCRDDRLGMLTYRIELDRPYALKEHTPLTVIWQALRPTSYSSLNFLFEADGYSSDSPLTAVTARDKNILGVGFDPIDGVLGGGVTVEPRERKARRQLQGKEEELREMFLGDVGARTYAGLTIEPPQAPIHVGDVFPVEVRLRNPEGALIDSVDFMLEWDPRAFEAVDKDRGNWIRRGINGHDGPFVKDFPFESLNYNEALNERGTMRYSASMTDGRALPSSAFVVLYLRAKRPTDGSTLRFLRSRPGEPQLTSLRHVGYEVSDLAPPLTKASANISVLPAPPGYQPVDASAPPPPAGGEQ